MSLAPIVLFVYNRPWHTLQTVEALQHCELASKSELYIFADGPKIDVTEEILGRINEVRRYIRTIDGFAKVIIDEAKQNIGCADSIIRGIGNVIKKHGKAIIVEDDIVAHPFFLRFMNETLDAYEKDKRIFCISATMEYFQIPSEYQYDIFLTHRTGSWGWATWSDRWNMVNWNINSYPIIKYPTKHRIKRFCRGGDDLYPMLLAQQRGDIDAWDIRFCYNMSTLNKLCLRPVFSYVQNIGMDNTGTHCGSDAVPLLPLYSKPTYDVNLIQCVSLNKTITRNIQAIFQQEQKRIALAKWAKRKIKKTLFKLHLWDPNS